MLWCAFPFLGRGDFFSMFLIKFFGSLRLYFLWLLLGALVIGMFVGFFLHTMESFSGWHEAARQRCAPVQLPHQSTLGLAFPGNDAGHILLRWEH